MATLRLALGIAWAVFWIGWLLAAANANSSLPLRGRGRLGGLSVVAVVIMLRVLGRNGPVVQSPVLGGVGAGLFVCGIALAIWARLHLGRNWGMPMSQRAEPELVTSGPYRLVRHPIYSGLILALLGTALASNLFGLIVAALALAFFYYAATVEEDNMVATFPEAYPAYQAHSKKLIPFVL
jgi:protein-S-isoprenylcysteine O-methyltransferase Ste14